MLRFMDGDVGPFVVLFVVPSTTLVHYFFVNTDLEMSRSVGGDYKSRFVIYLKLPQYYVQVIFCYFPLCS